MTEPVIKLQDGEPVLTPVQKEVQQLASKIATDAVYISGNYTTDQVMEVMINNLQVLVSSFIPFNIPAPVIAYLKTRKLTEHQLGLLQSLSTKVIAYSGMVKK